MAVDRSVQPPLEKRPHRPAPGLVRWLLGGGAILGVALLCVLALRHDPTVPVVRRDDLWYPAGDRYAGTQSCVRCHGALVDQQKVTAHATTVRRLTKGKGVVHPGGPGVRDPQTGAIYRVEPRKGKDSVVLRSGPLEAAASLEWEFGSGRHAQGYIARMEDGGFVDCRLNWYHETNGWYFASGQDKPTRTLLDHPLGRPLSKGEINRCFSCHSTELRAEGEVRAGLTHDQIQVNPDRSVVGVLCEGCHGPRAAHVAAFEQRKPTPRPAKMTAIQINELCGQCHSRSDLNPVTAIVARFQPWSLERSRCFQASQGRLSCLTCHDPHGNAESSPTYYNARCLSCHSREAVTQQKAAHSCPVNKTDNCISCHMPRDSTSMLHITFTDHRIRVPSD